MREHVRMKLGNRIWLWIVVCGLVAAWIVTAVEPLEAATRCGSIQSRINSASAGATIDLPDNCIYREMVTISKPLKLKGGPGVEIRGSEVWTNWSKSGSYWTKGRVPSFTANGYCEEGTNRCRWPEQVFFDGKALTQVVRNPQSGQFAVNGARQVVLADDPNGHTVEVSVRRQWVVGKSGGVTVEGFTMKHAANNGQRHGAIVNGSYSNWTIQNNVLSDAHGSVVNLSRGTNLNLIGNDISRGGQMGVAGGGGKVLLRDNKIHDNNTELFSMSFGAAGMKMGAVQSLTADGNEVYNNRGPGLHCDVGCQNVVFSDNRVYNNYRMGLNFEKSSGAKIFGNELWENGWGRPNWGWGAGIVSSSSKNVEIHNNTLAWNADGISVISQNRGGTDHDRVTGVSVHDNTVLLKELSSNESQTFSLAWLQDWGGVMYQRASNNRGSTNRYWYASAEGAFSRFGWEGPKKKLSEFNATLGEERGTYMNSTVKEQVVSAEDLPSLPRRR